MTTINDSIFSRSASFLHRGGRRFFVESVLEKTKGQNIDTFVQYMQSYGVDDARALIKECTQKPASSWRVCVISFNTITVEAQNALLKVLEEEHYNTSIVMAVNENTALIPTVISRVINLDTVYSTSGTDSVVSIFLSATYKDRLKLVPIKDIFSTNKKELPEREEIVTFFSEVINQMHKSGVPSDICMDSINAVSLINKPSSSLKQIVEYLVLRIPVTK